MNRPGRVSRLGAAGAAGLALLGGLAAQAHEVAMPDPYRDDAVVRKALDDELARSMKELRMGPSPRPYYLGYGLTDTKAANVSATFGALTLSHALRLRNLRVDLRVGDASFDNSNFEGNFFGGRGAPLPVEDDYASLRRALWSRSDDAYKAAVEALSKKRAAAQSQAKSDEDAVADFAPQAPATIVTPASTLLPQPGMLENTVVRLSAVFRSYRDVQSSRADATWSVVRRRFLASDGTWTDESRSVLRVAVAAETQADDGMPLRDFVVFSATEPKGLPPVADMEKAVRRMADELVALRKAPVADNGTAAVLFEGTAAAQIAHGLLSDQLSGTPPPKTAGQERSQEGSEWASKIGQKVTAPSLTVVDDPTMASGPGKTPLFGAYKADDEGVPAQRVVLIDGGILKSLLMTRTPRKEIGKSNGHARATPFGSPSARAGTLIITGKGGLARPALLAALEKARKSSGATAAYVVRLLDDGSVMPTAMEDAMSSFRFMMGGGRGGATPVKPLVVYRVKDGKEEPVRGLTLEGLLPKSWKDVVAVGKEPVVYNFTEPASGFFGIPSAIVTPPLLFSDVDVKKQTGKNRKPPLYGHPAFAGK